VISKPKVILGERQVKASDGVFILVLLLMTLLSTRILILLPFWGLKGLEPNKG